MRCRCTWSKVFSGCCVCLASCFRAFRGPVSFSTALSRNLCRLVPGAMTGANCVTHWRKMFEQEGISEPQHSSEHIVSHVLGGKTIHNLAEETLSRPLTTEQKQMIWDLCSRRLQHMPVQYVIEEWNFRDLTLKIKPPVFIPRPETERSLRNLQTTLANPSKYSFLCLSFSSRNVGHDRDNSLLFFKSCHGIFYTHMSRQMGLGLMFHLKYSTSNNVAVPQYFTDVRLDYTPKSMELVSLVLSELTKEEDVSFYVEKTQCQNSHRAASPLFLEIGCGSGAIILSLLHFFKQSRAVVVDKSADAVTLTRENAERLCVQHRLQESQLNIISDSQELARVCGSVDVIVSNPPYVFHEDMSGLMPEILRYEDNEALDGGADGMDVIRAILLFAPNVLRDHGKVFLEVDPRHPEMIQNWLQEWPSLRLIYRSTHRDICGKQRFCILQRS